MDFKGKTFLISIGLSIGLALFFFLVIFSLFKDITTFSDELLIVKKELMLIAEKSKELFIWEKDHPDLEPSLREIGALLINPEIPINFLQFLEKTANDSQVSVQISLLSSEKETNGPFSFLRFKISLIGKFSDCLRFLDKLGSAPYLSEVEALSSAKLREDRLKLEKYQNFSSEDVEFSLLIKVFTNNEN